MPILKQALGWTDSPEDYVFYLSVNPTKDEVGFYKVLPEKHDDDDSSIIKLNTFKDFGSVSVLDYSQSSIGLVGVGEKSGDVKLFNVIGNNFDHVYSNTLTNNINKAYEQDNQSVNSGEFQPGNSFDNQKLLVKPKYPRCINSLSFSSNRSLVAMGLEKHKNDYSLQVWDVNYQSSANESVNTSFQYFFNETILSSQFIDETNLLVSSPKFLREIDLRLPNPVFQLPTSLGQEIKINPFNSYVFATYSENGTSSIWDRRKLNSKLLEQQDFLPSLQFDKNATFYNISASNSAFVDHSKDTISNAGANTKKFNHLSFRWSTLRSEEFSTLNNSFTIKRWRMGKVPSVSSESTYDSLFVSTVNTVELPFDRVVTFDYIPRINNKTSFLCMRQSGTVYRCSVQDSTSKIHFNSSNDLITADYDKLEMHELDVGTRFSRVDAASDITPTLQQLSLKELGESVHGINKDLDDSLYEDSSIFEIRKRNKRHSTVSKKTMETEETSYTDYDEGSDEDEEYVINMDPTTLLQNDISMIMRRRAIMNYGLEPFDTVEMIDKVKSLQTNTHIRNTWRWLAIAKNSVDDGATLSTKLDIGYEGILGIWNGLEGLTKQNRCRSGEDLTEKELVQEMEAIVKLRSKNGLGNNGVQNHILMKKTRKAVQRKLCMIISGWDLSSEEIEEKYKALMDLKQYEKAAGWAVFFGDVSKAIEILSGSKKQKLQLIATAVAGYSKNMEFSRNNNEYDNDDNEDGFNNNNVWREQCRNMSMELDNPYLRAIFAYIADNDWWDILYDASISLRERLGVALRFLSDKDLTMFLERASKNVISRGELEGLILTGVTPSGIDLLESYVEKTSDVQTAALISVYGCPRYFLDKRVDQWVSTYRDLLNNWEFFIKRSKFDILKTKMSRNSFGKITQPPKPRQLYIQCIKCKKNINSNEGDMKAQMKKMRKQKVPGSAQLSGFNNNNGNDHWLNNQYTTSEPERAQQKYSCPHCGTSFPRCAICLLPLGIANLPIVVQGSSVTTNTNEHGENDHKQGSNNNRNIHSGDNGDNGDFDSNARSHTEYEAAIMEKRKLKLNEWFSFCLTCNHGMHAGHAEEWFERHYICPVPGCSCNCVYS